MKLRFQADQIKVVGLGLVPWTRLGLQQWLPHYSIASLYGWDLPPTAGLPPVYALNDVLDNLPVPAKLRTQALLEIPAFQQILTGELANYDIMTYKPVRVPEVLAGRKFLMTDERFTTKFENKVQFRKLFAADLPFPAFTICQRADLTKTQDSFADLMAERSAVVIQDEQLSGGRGTFIVRSYEDYCQALDKLNDFSTSPELVVSVLVVDARERSIQGCVTERGVFTGPLQRQMVGHPLLANPSKVGDQFCGASILANDQGTSTQQQSTEITQHIGERLRAEGYRGIFGVDFLLDANEKLYVIEVNARITGVTPLLAALYAGPESIPFYLLHVLELGQYPYEILDATSQFSAEGSLLVMHSLEDRSVEIAEMPKSGTYTVENGELTLVSRTIDMGQLEPEQFVLQAYMMAGSNVKPGGRLANLLFAHSTIDENTDELYNRTVELLAVVRQHLITRA